MRQKLRTSTSSSSTSRPAATATTSILQLLSSQCFVLLLLLLVLPHPSSGSFVVNLQRGELHCFIYRIPDRPSVISGNYDLLHENAPSDVVRVTLEMMEEPYDIIWKKDVNVREETFRVAVKPKAHCELCFSMADQTDDDDVERFGVKIGFNLRIHSAIERTLPEGVHGPDSARAITLIQEMDGIMLNWQNMLDHFEFLREREAQHMYLTKQILKRVMTWTILEAILVVSMAIGQVVYWKKFFEQKRYL